MINLALLSAAATAHRSVAPFISKLLERRWAKFGYREGHFAEKTARIVLFGGDAFLVRYAIVGGGDKVLGGPLDANDRKDTECDV